jgi:hypothetical protein
MWFNLFLLSRKITRIIGRKVTLDARAVFLFVNGIVPVMIHSELIARKNYFEGSDDPDAVNAYLQQRAFCYFEIVVITVLMSVFFLGV